MKKGVHRGPSVDSFLIGERLYDELKTIAAKEAIAWQLQQAMKKQRISKKKLEPYDSWLIHTQLSMAGLEPANQTFRRHSRLEHWITGSRPVMER